MSQNKKKLQYSKMLPIITILLFIVCLYVGFSQDFNNVVDMSFYVTAITISGGIAGTCIVFYLKKAQSENNVKLRIEMYKQASNERIKYNEAMFKLKKDYQVSDEDIDEIEEDSPMDEFESTALSSIESVIDESQNDSDSPIELQSFN